MGNTIDAISVNGTGYKYAWGGVAEKPFGETTVTPLIGSTTVTGPQSLSSSALLAPWEDFEQGDELLLTVDGTVYVTQLRRASNGMVAGSGSCPVGVEFNKSDGGANVYPSDSAQHTVSASVRRKSKVGKEYLPFDGGATFVAYSGATTLESNGDYYECSIPIPYDLVPKRFDYLRVTVGDASFDVRWADNEGAYDDNYGVYVRDNTGSQAASSVDVSSQTSETELDITVAFVLEPKIPTHMIPSVGADTSSYRLSIVDALNLLSDCINAVISGESPDVPLFSFDGGDMPNVDNAPVPVI